MTSIDCRQCRDLAPELALGLLAGDERGAAIEHVASCAPCRVHLEALVRVADHLLLLAPVVEPDIGFESRVMAKLAAAGAIAAPPPPAVEMVAARRRRWTFPVAAGIAACLVIIAGVVGLAVGRNSGRASAIQTQVSTVTKLGARVVIVRADEGHEICQLVAFPAIASEPARLTIHLDEPGEPSGSYEIVAVRTHGPAVQVGTITTKNGEGSWMAAIPPGTGPVQGVRIMEGPNDTKYWATFPPI